MVRLLHLTLLFSYHFLNFAEGKRSKMRETAYLYDFSPCPGVEYIGKLNTTSVHKAQDDSRLFLTIDHEQDLEPVSALFDVKLCKTKSLEDCEDFIKFPIDDLCTIFKEQTVYNSMILEHLKPPLRSCPVKAPHVMNDFPVNLLVPETKKFLGIKYSREEQVIFAQIHIRSNEETIVCIKFVGSFLLVRNRS